MSLVERMGAFIGRKARIILNINENEEEIIVYGAINLIQTITAILWIVVVSILFGVFYEALLFSVVVAILRKYSGGVHASSPGRCSFMGTFVSVSIAILIDKILYKLTTSNIIFMCIICLLISYIIIYLRAPVDSINKPITDSESKRWFKRNSIVVLSLFSIIIVIFYLFDFAKFMECVALGVLWQSFTLTRCGMNIVNNADSALKYISKGSD